MRKTIFVLQQQYTQWNCSSSRSSNNSLQSVSSTHEKRATRERADRSQLQTALCASCVACVYLRTMWSMRWSTFPVCVCVRVWKMEWRDKFYCPPVSLSLSVSHPIHLLSVSTLLIQLTEFSDIFHQFFVYFLLFPFCTFTLTGLFLNKHCITRSIIPKRSLNMWVGGWVLVAAGGSG